MADTKSTKPRQNDWQQSKSLRECHEYMLEKQLACDVKFKLQTAENKVVSKMGAHKFVLMSRSPVFFAMFEGPMKETSDEIVITDIEGEPFRQFLRYLYLDEVHLSDATCVGILYAAKKYMVTSLQEKCKEYLKQHMRQETVCTALEHAVQMNEEDLEEKALEYIDERTEECLQSSLFKQISHETLCRILERDTLSAEEVDIFRACLEWAGARCLEEGVPVSVDKIRQDLGKALYLVRFPVMDISDFSNEVVNRGLLSDKEVISVFLTLTREKPPPNLQFSSVERSGQLLNMTSVFTTGLNRTALTAGTYKTLEGAHIYAAGKDVTLKCVYFANISREAFKKVKRVNVLVSQTGVSHPSDIVRGTDMQGKLDNGFYNAKAVFKGGIVLKTGTWNNITFHSDPPLTHLEAIYFQGTPAMMGNGIQFTFQSGSYYQFTGIGFTKKY